MKRSNLALAVLTAIAVAACGGSSSNDDAPVDKKPETPAKPVKPTTPEAGNTETPEEKTPETPETPAVAGGGAGGAGGKTDTTKKDEKKPEAPAGGGHGGGKPKPQTPEAAAVAVVEAKIAHETADTKAKELAANLTKAEQAQAAFESSQKNTELESLLKKEKEGTLLPTEKPTLANLKDQKAQLDDEVKKLTAEKVAAEMAVLERDADVTEAEINELNAKEAPKSAILVKDFELKEKQAKITEKLEEKNETDAREAAAALTPVINKLTTRKGELNTILTNNATKSDSKEFQDAKKELEQVEQDLNTETSNQNKFTKEEARAKEAKEQAQADQVAAKANQGKAKEWARFTGRAAIKETYAEGKFPQVQLVKKVDNVWEITFAGSDDPMKLNIDKSGEGAAVDIGDATTPAESYGVLGKAKKAQVGEDGKKEEQEIGSFAFKSYEDDGKTTVAFGYADGHFFHFGQATPEADINNSLNGATYNGTAFVKTKGKNSQMLVSSVTATVDFNKVAPAITGNFNSFKTYLNEKGEKVDPTSVEKEVLDLTTSNNQVTFTSFIKGNSFAPNPSIKETDAKVYGNFYGTADDKKAKKIGGLVDHPKFYGSFGGKKDE